MKNKLKAIFFLIFLPVLLFALQANAECTEDEREDAKEKYEESIEKNLSNLETLMNAYNKAAQDYENNKDCPQAVNGTPFMPSAQAIMTVNQKLEGKQKFMATQSNFEKTAINWEAMSSNNATCKNLIEKAKSAKNAAHEVFYDVEIGLAIKRNGNDVPVSCFCEETSGDKTCVTYADSTDKLNGDLKGCEPLTGYMADLSKCPLCPIFKILLRTNSDLARISWEALASAFKSVVVVFFAVLLAIETLKSVGSTAGMSPGSYLKNVLTLGLKVTATYIALSNSSYIYGYFISPVLKGALDVAMELLSIGNPGAMACYKLPSGYTSAPSDFIDGSLGGSIYNAVICFSNSAATLPAVGRALICHGWYDTFLPNLSMWFNGLIFYLFGMALWIAICFYLIDCTVQIGIVSALVPMLIACWPFKPTRRYCVSGIKLIMNTFFCFVLMGVVLTMAIVIMGYAGGTNESSGISEFIEALNNNDTERLNELASLDLQQAFVLVCCAILTFKLIGQSCKIAEKFSSSSGSSIGAKLGGAASSAMTAVAQTGLKTGGRVAGAALSATGVSGAISKVGTAIGGAALSGASKAGKLVGLGRFQPSAQRSAQNPSAKPTSGNTQNGSKPDSNNPKSENGGTDRQNQENSNQTGNSENSGNNNAGGADASSE